MSAAETLVNNLGEEIPAGKRGEVIRQIEAAIRDRTFHFIERQGRPIGFFTYIEKGDKILVNNCYVFKEERGTHNLLQSRHFLKEKNRLLYWLNGRRKRRVEYAPS